MTHILLIYSYVPHDATAIAGAGVHLHHFCFLYNFCTICRGVLLGAARMEGILSIDDHSNRISLEKTNTGTQPDPVGYSKVGTSKNAVKHHKVMVR